MLHRHRAAHALLAMLLIVTLLPTQGIPPSLTPVARAQTMAPWFPAPVDIVGSVGVAISVALGDADGDGALDLVIGNRLTDPLSARGNGSQLYRNDGRGGFVAVESEHTGGWSITGAAWADLDGDGHLDLAHSHQTGLIDGDRTVYRNDGTGRLVAGSLLPANTWLKSTAVAAADLDGDKAVDLVFANDSTLSQVYRNNGQGGFSQPVTLIGSTRDADSVAVSDLDGDGSPDIVLGNTNGRSQVYINDGQGGFGQPTDLALSRDTTTQVALGDLNGDGALDIVLANATGLSQVYLGDGRGAFGQPADLPESNGTAVGVALGDVDSDGSLDIVLGNTNGLSQIYRNDRFGRFAAPVDLPLSGRGTSSVAVGDLDGDGSLDIVLGNASGLSQVYRNTGRDTFFNSELEAIRGTYTLPFSGRATTGVAVGDLDGDGSLDIVLGNASGLSQVYLGDGRGAFGQPADLADSPPSTSVAVADVSGQARLDIVLGATAGGAQFYRNLAGGQFGSPERVSSGSVTSIVVGDLNKIPGFPPVTDLPTNDLLFGTTTGFGITYDVGGIRTGFAEGAQLLDPMVTSVVLGDLDGDGFLDFILGRRSGPTEVRLSRRSRITLPYDGRDITSLALGDLDGDGALDLVAGKATGLSQVYRNDGRGNFAPPISLPFSGRSTTSVAVGDLSGDGALDIVLGNASGLSQIYRNDGDGGFATPLDLLFGGLSTSSVALGDFNGDGAVDIVLGKSVGPSLVSIQQNGFAGQTVSTPPTVQVGHPGIVAAGPLYASPRVFDQRYISIPFTLADAEGDSVGAVRGEYSYDGGTSWRPARPRSITATLKLAAPPAGTSYSFDWDVYADGDPAVGFFGSSDAVVFRLTVIPAIGRRAYQVAGTYAHGARSSLSQPFSVQGNAARVMQANNKPVAGALVYALPTTQTRGAAALTRRLTGGPIRSNALGYVNSRDPIRPGDQLVAVQPVTSTDRLTYAYTSAAPSEAGLSGGVVGLNGGTQTMTVSPKNPLLLLNLKVGLEWNARGDTAFMESLRARLQRTSELLYDWTDGQVALGELTILQDRQSWDHVLDPQGNVITRGVDIRVYASNAVRPNATQGGITSRVFTETFTIAPTLTRPIPSTNSVTYEPGYIRMGASWNSQGDPDRDVAEEWARALAHEVGHFALYLDETYLGREGELLVPVDGCASPMNDPYLDSNSEFRPPQDWPADCTRTLQHLSTGLSEWAQISRRYTRTQAANGFDFAFNIPLENGVRVNSGPAVLPIGVTTFSAEAPNLPVGPAAATYGVLPPDGGRYDPQPGARALIFPAGNRPPLDLGAPSVGLVQTRGLRPGDQLCVFDPEAQFAGCNLTTSGLRLSELPEAWRPQVLLTPVASSDSTTMTLRVDVLAASVGTLQPTQTLQLTFYPREGNTTPLLATLTLRDGSYHAELALTEVIEDGLVRLWVEPSTPRREAVVDYAVGGNPAKQTRPPRKTRRKAPAVSTDGQATLFAEELAFTPGQFFTLQRTANLPALPGWATLVGQGYRLIASDVALLNQSLALSLSYPEGDVPQGLERDVRMLFHDGTSWRELDTRVDRARNEAVVKVVAAPGTYALVTSVRLRLSRPGWNLIYSYPGATQVLPQALAGAAGRYQLVYGYDGADPDNPDPWKLYAPGLAAPWSELEQLNDLDELVNGASYWVRTTEPVTIPLRLEVGLAATIDEAGDALAAPPATYYGLSPFGPRPLSIEAYVGEEQTACGTTTTEKITLDGVEQQGFAVNVLANGAGSAEGCGSRGVAVRLVFYDDKVEVGSLKTTWDNSRLTALGLNRVFLPLVAVPVAPQPNLQVVGVTLVPAPQDSGEAYELLVRVRNAGTSSATAPYGSEEGGDGGGNQWRRAWPDG